MISPVDVEWATGTDSLIASSQKPVPPGTDMHRVVIKEDVEPEARVDCGKAGYELKVAEAAIWDAFQSTEAEFRHFFEQNFFWLEGRSRWNNWKGKWESGVARLTLARELRHQLMRSKGRTARQNAHRVIFQEDLNTTFSRVQDGTLVTPVAREGKGAFVQKVTQET